MATYCVKAETAQGRVVTLGRGFDSKQAAEDYRLQLKLSRPVWVERVSETAPEPPPVRRTRNQNLERAYDAIVDAALKGERCPENGTRGVDTRLCRQLAASGRIKVEVFARNYRVVTILTGPYADKKTAPPPYNVTQPKLIITANGTKVIKRFGTAVPESVKHKPEITEA